MSQNLEIVTVPCRSDNYAYLIRDAETGETAVVDAPAAAPILAALSERGWRADQILLTHHHGDHVEGVAEIKAAFGSKVIGAKADAARLPPLDTALAEGESWSVGASTATVIDVSGHTVGHIAFYFAGAGAVFTGDSLMALGCGRVFEGTHLMMWESLSKLAALPPETMVYSGHNYGQANGRFAMSIEPDNAELVARIREIEKADAEGAPIVPVSVATELATNPFLRARIPSVQNAVSLPGGDAAAVFAEVRRRKDAF